MEDVGWRGGVGGGEGELIPPAARSPEEGAEDGWNCHGNGGGVGKKGRTGVMDRFCQHLGLQQRVLKTDGIVMETEGDEDCGAGKV